MRLIDADAVKNPYEGTSLEWQGVLMLKLIQDAPTINAVPVVRCKDCKWWEEDRKMCGIFPDQKQNGYCHDGERKDND